MREAIEAAFDWAEVHFFAILIAVIVAEAVTRGVHWLMHLGDHPDLWL